MTLRDLLTGAVVADRLRVADGHWSRLRGLLGTRTLPEGAGLWIRPCSQVHMIGMRYALDVLFLDDALRVVHVVEDLRPNRLSPRIASASSVVELPAGTARRLALAAGTSLIAEGTLPPAGASDELARVATNVCMALLFLGFATAHLQAGLHTGRWLTVLPTVMQELLFVVLFLIRRPTIALSQRPMDWVTGIVGTFAPFFLRPAAEAAPTAVLGAPLQALGFVLATVAMSNLGRSLGLVAANRGVKTSGCYRLVRHPIYGAYLIGFAGYLLSHPTPWNAAIVAMVALALEARAQAEERVLAADPTYSDYLARTRWRFVPLVY